VKKKARKVRRLAREARTMAESARALLDAVVENLDNGTAHFAVYGAMELLDLVSARLRAARRAARALGKEPPRAAKKTA
jgi:hypothetical protein